MSLASPSQKEYGQGREAQDRGAHVQGEKSRGRRRCGPGRRSPSERGVVMEGGAHPEEAWPGREALLNADGELC